MSWLTSIFRRPGSKSVRAASRRSRPSRGFLPEFEALEDRTVPALLASQVPFSSLPPLNLIPSQVATLLARAAAATSSDNAIVAVVDRNGDILGVRVEGNVSPAVTGDQQILDYSIDGAVALARTTAFFSSNADPLTSRTIGFISQSTITQREVNSYSFISNPASTLGGPGFVAPIEIGGNFPPGVADSPLADLFDVEENQPRNARVSGGQRHSLHAGRCGPGAQ